MHIWMADNTYIKHLKPFILPFCQQTNSKVLWGCLRFLQCSSEIHSNSKTKQCQMNFFRNSSLCQARWELIETVLVLGWVRVPKSVKGSMPQVVPLPQREEGQNWGNQTSAGCRGPACSQKSVRKHTEDDCSLGWRESGQERCQTKVTNMLCCPAL